MAAKSKHAFTVIGRPSKYHPKRCDTVLEVGAKGGWLCEMAEACNVHRNTLDNWAKTYPEFNEALSRAKQKAQAFFEREARVGMLDGTINAKVWQTIMAGRHPEMYSERRRTQVRGYLAQAVRETEPPKGDLSVFTRFTLEAEQ